MRIAHITDLHEDFESLEKTLAFLSAQSTVPGRKIDLIACTGDLNLEPYTVEAWRKYLDNPDGLAFREHVLDLSRQKYQRFKGIFDAAGIPYFVIPGNYDTTVFDDVFGKRNLHNKTAKFRKLTIGGFGGGEPNPAYIHLIVEKNTWVTPKKQVIQGFNEGYLYSFLTANKPEILLVHQPPRGLLDCTIGGEDWGSAAFRQYLDAMREHPDGPRAALVGHVHESGPLGNNPRGYQGVMRHGRIVISNSGNLGRFGIYEKDTMKELPKLERGTLGWGTFAILEMEASGRVKAIEQYTLRDPENTRGVGDIQELGRLENPK